VARPNHQVVASVALEVYADAAFVAVRAVAREVQGQGLGYELIGASFGLTKGSWRERSIY
jgi:hypothetical protein